MKPMCVNPALVVLFTLLVAWHITASIGGPIIDLVGTPVAMASELVGQLASADTWSNIAVTFFELVLGLAFAVVIGLLIALGLGTSRSFHDALGPFLVAGNSVPKVIFLPMFMMLLGVAHSSKIAFGALHGLIPIAIIVSNGARKVLNSEQLKSAIMMNATRPQLIRTILIPSVLPYFVTALRLAVSLTLLGVLLAEMYVSRVGLGYQLMRWYEELQIQKMLSVVMLIGIMAAIFDFLLRRLEVHIWRIHGIQQKG